MVACSVEPKGACLVGHLVVYLAALMVETRAASRVVQKVASRAVLLASLRVVQRVDC